MAFLCDARELTQNNSACINQHCVAAGVSKFIALRKPQVAITAGPQHDVTPMMAAVTDPDNHVFESSGDPIPLNGAAGPAKIVSQKSPLCPRGDGGPAWPRTESVG